MSSYRERRFNYHSLLKWEFLHLILRSFYSATIVGVFASNFHVRKEASNTNPALSHLPLKIKVGGHATGKGFVAEILTSLRDAPLAF